MSPCVMLMSSQFNAIQEHMFNFVCLTRSVQLVDSVSHLDQVQGMMASTWFPNHGVVISPRCLENSKAGSTIPGDRHRASSCGVLARQPRFQRPGPCLSRRSSTRIKKLLPQTRCENMCKTIAQGLKDFTHMSRELQVFPQTQARTCKSLDLQAFGLFGPNPPANSFGPFFSLPCFPIVFQQNKPLPIFFIL